MKVQIKFQNLFIGRLSRVSFVIGFVLTLIGYAAIAGITIGLARIYLNYRDSNTSVIADHPFLIPLLIVLYSPIILYQASVFVKRLHDLNLQGAWVLVLPGSTLIPPLGAFIWIISPILLALIPGSKGINKFGKESILIQLF